MLFQQLGDLAQSSVRLGHDCFQFRNRFWRANAGDDILALRIHKKLAIKISFAGRWITGERHTSRAVFSQIAKHHSLNVHRSPPVVRYMIEFPIGDSAVIVPRPALRTQLSAPIRRIPPPNAPESDVPLLFETGGEKHVDAVVVVTASPELQRERILARDNMTGEKFDAILARQLPDAEKRRRADFVVDTSNGPDPVRAQIRDILREVAKMPRRRA